MCAASDSGRRFLALVPLCLWGCLHGALGGRSTQRLRRSAKHKDPSLWQFLLSDRVTLGFLRAAIAGLVLYVAISIPALVAGGRWLRGFGTSGLTADDAKVVTDLEAKVVDLTNKLNEATEQADRLKEERNTLRSLVTSVLRRSHQTPTRRDVFPIVEEPGRQQDERGRTETDPEETGGG